MLTEHSQEVSDSEACFRDAKLVIYANIPKSEEL